MQNLGNPAYLKCHGNGHMVYWVRWAPSNATTQTLTHNGGVISITRLGAGQYQLNLEGPCKQIAYAECTYIEDDTTNYHFTRVASHSAAARTVTVEHRSVAFASVASGATLSDTVDELCVILVVGTVT